MSAHGPRASHGVEQPCPGDFLEHWVRGDIVLELCPGEYHRAEGAVPLIDAIGIVKQDETPRGAIVVKICHLGRDCHGMRRKSLWSWTFLDHKVRSNRGGSNAGQGVSEGIGRRVDGSHLCRLFVARWLEGD